MGCEMEEVFCDLNGMWDGLGYHHFGRLRRRVQIFGGSEKYVFVIFVRCAFVCVFVICLSLVLGGCRCAGHKTALCFWLCYGGCSLIVVLNQGRGSKEQGSVSNHTHNQQSTTTTNTAIMTTTSRCISARCMADSDSDSHSREGTSKCDDRGVWSGKNRDFSC